ncbi:hypothetical protein [Anabaena azotica]|nr:hypothetical protein [Anabaena azotica]
MPQVSAISSIAHIDTASIEQCSVSKFPFIWCYLQNKLSVRSPLADVIFAEVVMKRRICLSCLALPIYFYNAEVNLVNSSEVESFINPFLNTTALVASSYNIQLQIMPWQISARDEQTKECLRKRKCKD